MESSFSIVGDQGLIDSLPYIDAFTEQDRINAQNLVNLEKKTFKPQGKLDLLAPPPETLFADNELLAKEYARICQKQTNPKAASEKFSGVDTKRLEIPAPKSADPADWAEANNNAIAQLMHQHIRLLNLELLNKHAPNVWIKHIDYLNKEKQLLSKELEKVSAETVELNRRRKLNQELAAEQLTYLHNLWYDTVQKNHMIETTCIAIEQKIEQMGATPVQHVDADVIMSDSVVENSKSNTNEEVLGQDNKEIQHTGSSENDTGSSLQDNATLPNSNSKNMKKNSNTNNNNNSNNNTTNNNAETQVNARKQMEIELTDLTVKELQEELGKRGLPKRGNKSELIQRLIDAKEKGL